jgi:hypothetical protein
MNKLVTAVAEDDSAAFAWLRASGFEQVGRIASVTRSPGPVSGSPQYLVVELATLQASIPEAIDQFVSLAVTTLNAIPLPGGALLHESPQSVRSAFINEPLSDGLLVALDGKNMVGWMALETIGGEKVLAQAVQAHPNQRDGGVERSLLIAALKRAEQVQSTLCLYYNPDGQPELREAVDALQFQDVPGRAVWYKHLEAS